MPLDWVPLDPAALSDSVRRVLGGPPPGKLMAAKGLAPLKPAELAVVLYHLAQLVISAPLATRLSDRP